MRGSRVRVTQAAPSNQGLTRNLLRLRSSVEARRKQPKKLLPSLNCLTSRMVVGWRRSRLRKVAQRHLRFSRVPEGPGSEKAVQVTETVNDPAASVGEAWTASLEPPIFHRPVRDPEIAGSLFGREQLVVSRQGLGRGILHFGLFRGTLSRPVAPVEAGTSTLHQNWFAVAARRLLITGPVQDRVICNSSVIIVQ